MTTTYQYTQFAQVAGPIVDLTAVTALVDGLNVLCAAIRFQFSANIYFLNTLSLNILMGGVWSGVNPTETYQILIIKDPDLISTLSNGNIGTANLPVGYSGGTAPSSILSTLTVTDYGQMNFNLDLAEVTRIMATSTGPANIWNGSLLFWLVGANAEDGDGGVNKTTPNSISLVAYDTIEYTNRDTGSPGINSSRWDRCPVSGLKVPRGEMVLDGWRNTLVAPADYDPPEPDPMDWDDIPDPNENIG